MSRDWLLKKLHSYRARSEAESNVCGRFMDFVSMHPDCFERSQAVGHVTGSAWIVSPDLQRAVLIYHQKLKKWVQPGGHSDGDPRTLEVARREGLEETGLTGLQEVSDEIFDLDIHEIPLRSHEPAHLHYDVRFLFCARGDESLRVNEEVNELAWFKPDEILKMGLDESVTRMVRKWLSFNEALTRKNL